MTFRVSLASNFRELLTNTQAPRDQGANTDDQADLAQPVSERFQCISLAVKSNQYLYDGTEIVSKYLVVECL